MPISNEELQYIIEQSRADNTDVEGRAAIGAPPEQGQPQESNNEVIGFPLEKGEVWLRGDITAAP